jgi:hypothetical protein
MKTPEEVSFYAAVEKIPEGLKLADVGVQSFTIGLQQSVGAIVEVVSNIFTGEC